MATIRNRGEYQWEAQIRRKGYPAQRKTFETKSDAQAWARMIESEIDRGIFVSRVEAERTAFHQLLDRYISAIAPKHKPALVVPALSSPWNRWVLLPTQVWLILDPMDMRLGIVKKPFFINNITGV